MSIDIDLTEVYKDILQPIAQQAGVTLNEVAKLILAPIYYPVKTLNGRFEKWATRIKNNVSKDNRIQAQPNIIIPTLQNLALHQDETLLGEMFFNILQSSIDKTKQKFLSPAFPKILEQVSKDEAEILTLLKMYGSIDCIYYMRANENGIYEEEYIEISHHINKEFFAMYKNHLTFLGLLTGAYYQEAKVFFEIDGNLVLQNSAQGQEIIKNKQHDNYKSVVKYFYRLEFNAFGKAFAEVCISKKCEQFLNNIA